MNAVETRNSRMAFVTWVASSVSVIGMIAAFALQANSGKSTALAVLIAASVVAAFVGALGGLLLANWRRNVMWILAVAVSMTAMLALFAGAVVTFGMK
ncbi:MAG: hypothetical protein JSR27_13405 [Proteobacteria bacterium]|nr:hypothetical protein [Pseudomonadota bacterium]